MTRKLLFCDSRISQDGSTGQDKINTWKKKTDKSNSVLETQLCFGLARKKIYFWISDVLFRLGKVAKLHHYDSRTKSLKRVDFKQQKRSRKQKYASKFFTISEKRCLFMYIVIMSKKKKGSSRV